MFDAFVQQIKYVVWKKNEETRFKRSAVLF